jgi:AAA domain
MRYETTEQARQRRDGKPPETPPSKPPLALTFFEELDKPTPKPWLIKNVIARGETSSWIAPPGRGKSALLTDIAVHLAEGNDWRGFRTKARCGAVYFALERADLVKRRLTAHRLRDNLPNLPIAVSGRVINLMDETCVMSITDALKRATDRFGCEAGFAIFDTYSKGIAAGGGDESAARDQNIAIANLRRVIDKVNVHIATIGHTGKDETRGERGSNAKLADVDVLVQITGDVVKSAVTKKANDQPDGPLTAFQLEPFEFGPDEDGEPFRTFILSKEVMSGHPSADRKLNDRQQIAVTALADALLVHGSPAPSDYRIPTIQRVVTKEQWMAELYRHGALDREAGNPSARYAELRNALKRKSVIGALNDHVWLPNQAQAAPL